MNTRMGCPLNVNVIASVIYQARYVSAASASRHRKLLGFMCCKGISNAYNELGKRPISGGPGEVEAVGGNVCECERAQLWLSL